MPDNITIDDKIKQDKEIRCMSENQREILIMFRSHNWQQMVDKFRIQK